MATKIIKQPSAWQPVTIEMTFETREQLAVLVAITGSNSTIAIALAEPGNMPFDLVTNGMTAESMSNAIGNLVDYDTWEQLKNIVKTNS